MRAGCYECALKHLGNASVLVDEAIQGYPLFWWIACGHMDQAASELLRLDLALAVKIRSVRLEMQKGMDVVIVQNAGEIILGLIELVAAAKAAAEAGEKHESLSPPDA